MNVDDCCSVLKQLPQVATTPSLSFLPPVAIVGLRHAMWLSQKGRCTVIGSREAWHGKVRQGEGRRALGVDKRHRAGGDDDYWPTADLARLSSSSLALRIDVFSMLQTILSTTNCRGPAMRKLERLAKAGQRLHRTVVLVEISEALRRSRAYY